MLQMSGDLPEGALLGHEADRLAHRLRPSGAVWFSARGEKLLLEGDGADAPVAEWHSMTSMHTALPSRPNNGNGRFAADRTFPAMQFTQKVNCGYAVEAVTADARSFSMALIYASPSRDGRTLASLSARAGGNLFFLNEADGILTAKDRGGAISIECEAPAHENARELIMVSLEPSRLRLRVGRGPVIEARGDVSDMNGMGELFIGCRNHRAGLQKTLGDLLISDVIFWPSGSVLAAPGMAETEQSAAISEYWRWTR
ncbi:MAG: hypothetical protein WBB85_14465 [Albidovulum sp.]|uniref:hypothetical protein n=1 Tax=Albidovulum sp. TaxID=1872424 RepID=UPI003C82E3B4